MPIPSEGARTRDELAPDERPPVRVEELEEVILRGLALTVVERGRPDSSGVALERRLRDREADSAATALIWKLVGLSFFVSATIYLLLAFSR